MAVGRRVFAYIKRVQLKFVITLINPAHGLDHEAGTFFTVEDIAAHSFELCKPAEQVHHQGRFAAAGRGEDQVVADGLWFV